MNTKRRSRCIFFAVLLVLLAALVPTGVYLRATELARLGTPIHRAIAAHGFLYDLCNSESGLTLREIAPDGTLSAMLRISEAQKDETNEACSILAMRERLVYVWESRRSYSGSAYTNELAILVCDMNAGTVRELCAIIGANRSVTSVGDGLSDGYLHLAHRDSDGLRIQRIHAESGEVTDLQHVPLDAPILWFTVLSDGVFYAAASDSRVYRYDGVELTLAFQPEPGDCITQMRRGGGGDGLYLFLTRPGGNNALLKLDDAGRGFRLFRGEVADLLRFCVYDDDTWLGVTRAYAYRVYTGDSVRDIAALTVPWPLMLHPQSLAILTGISLLVATVAVQGYHLYRRRKFGLVFKLIAILLPVFVLGAWLLNHEVSNQVNRVMLDNTRSFLLNKAQEEGDRMSASAFAKINWDDPLSDAYYLTLRDELNRLSLPEGYAWQEGGMLGQGVRYSKYWLYRIDEEGQVSLAVSDYAFIGTEVHYYYRTQPAPALYQLYSTPIYTESLGGETEDVWLTVLQPLLDGDRLVGILEVSYPALDVTYAVTAVTSRTFVLFVGVFSAMLAVLVVVLTLRLRVLGRMKRAAMTVAAGDYDVEVTMRGRDEVNDIAAAFNSMAESVKRSVAHISAVSAGYERFVPDEMLSVLKKDSIELVNTADFASVRGVSMLLSTQSLDPYNGQRFFDELNRFYTRILPPIISAGGVVERLTGREAHVLFDCAPSGALEAVLALCAALNRLNDERAAEDAPPIACSIMLATTDVHLGIAGNDKLLSMVLLSRFAYQIDPIRRTCLHYGCRIMLEQTAFDELDASQYRYRLLGYILDGGTHRAIYDFYDGDMPESIKGKDATHDLFERSVGLYYSRRYEEARTAFIRILKQTPDDPAARMYLKNSHQKAVDGSPPDYLFEI